MTPFLVAFQGFTYKMTRVTLSICLTSGVHLNRSVTGRSNCALAFVFNKTLDGGWGWQKNLLDDQHFCQDFGRVSADYR
jgi:hypothetical protein